jgi:hypothetical protein
MKKIIKTIFILTLFFTVNSVTAQKIDLTNKDALISFLEKKIFEVGNYGEIEFKFENYNKDFLTLDFEVEYTIKTDKKPKKYKLWTSIILTNGEFYIPDYNKSIMLSEKQSIRSLRAQFPTMFELLNNGELYFVDKSTISFDDYYNKTIKGGDLNYGKRKYVLCKIK